jgi:16S rRNA (guanine527-N7)-methyltransferase
MPTLPTSRLQTLLAPYLGDFPTPAPLYDQLSTYLDLLLKWNARTNLTAIRDPEEIVRRHFGESLFAGVHLASRLAPSASLLDFGSGAGFPGLPIQLLLPHLHVTLAESQNKKATFLREVVRTLSLPTAPPPTKIHAARVEDLPANTLFEAITLRAVDNMPAALAAATPRLAPAGWLVLLTAEPPPPTAQTFPIPNTTASLLTLQQL